MKKISCTKIIHSNLWRKNSFLLKEMKQIYELCDSVCDFKVKKASFAVVYTDVKEMQELNKKYRNKDKPTNVLSFESGEVENGVTNIGDIVLCYEVIKEESDCGSLIFKNHLTHMLVHGILHLNGFDHIKHEDFEVMSAFEIKILHCLGIENPYI